MGKLTHRIAFFISIFLLTHVSCTKLKESTQKDFFSGEYPGKAEINLIDDEISLSNNAIRTIWRKEDNSIVLSEIENKYDGDIINMETITLFAIELADGRELSNRDFKLQGELTVSNLHSSDSLPKKSLRFPGKEITGLFLDKSENISIQWTAQLKEGSNYIRQNIDIKTIKTNEAVRRVLFFDGGLKGAVYAGSVLGSPIKYNNFFFGLEHPIAQSKALYSRTVGNIKQDSINVSEILKDSGEYVLCFEHGGGPDDFNIESVSLIENNKVISIDTHFLNGKDGNSFYHLTIEDYKPENKYILHTKLVNKQNATGAFHIYKKTNDLLNFYVVREDELEVGKSISEWSVIGVAPEGQQRRAFLYYLERERARPYKQFLHYNCWWDITDDGAASFTSEQLIERMHAWNEKFIEPYGVQLQSFVFDDGWDNLDSLWYFDPIKFPDGFTPQAELCKKYNSGIGVWMSPFGGYMENKNRRVESALREGLETNSKGLSLAGENYFNRFMERSLDMLNNYEVNYFKYDGFGGSEPRYLPDMEAGTDLIEILRQHNPDVFVNITVGSWPSPYWLKYADCTWRGSGDLHNAGLGSKTQKFMTYRDGTLHNNIVKRAPYYPLNSVMVVGIAYANLGHPSNYINDNKGDFTDMVWSFFGAGSNLQELYISHDRMKPEFWPILADAAKWSKKNEDILCDVHWIGGSPINLEVYGFAAWKKGYGVLTLRNPSDKPQKFNLDLKAFFEIPSSSPEKYALVNKLNVEGNTFEVLTNKPFEITLEPFELKVFEAKYLD
ncbi:MAG: hypothetical protein GY931_02130 [Maribacter sp.]|nr:hypothetical protein [Maribacter sp.]